MWLYPVLDTTEVTEVEDTQTQIPQNSHLVGERLGGQELQPCSWVDLNGKLCA